MYGDVYFMRGGGTNLDDKDWSNFIVLDFVYCIFLITLLYRIVSLIFHFMCILFIISL